MNHIESLEKKGYVVKLGVNGSLKIPKNMPEDLRKRVEEKKSVIIAELLEPCPLIKAIRERCGIKRKCSNCNAAVDLNKFPGGLWYWYECKACGDCRTLHTSSIAASLIYTTGFVHMICDHGIYALKKDNDTTFESGLPTFTIAELFTIHNCDKETLAGIFAIKKTIGGEISNDRTNIFGD